MSVDIRCWLLLSSAIAFVVTGCKEPGVVEVYPVPHSRVEAAAGKSGAEDAKAEESAGECPSGWSCMDLAALGFPAMDSDGDPVTATCSMGGPMACDDKDPSATCKGLAKPFCVHLTVGGQAFVSCAQRCSP